MINQNLGKERVHLRSQNGISYNKQSFDVVCTKEQIKELVMPILEFTAYLTTIDSKSELPSLLSMKAALAKPKAIIARFLANARGSVVDPENLSGISATILSHAGYVTVEFAEVVRTPGYTERRTYRMIMLGKTGKPLIFKMGSISIDDMDF